MAFEGTPAEAGGYILGLTLPDFYPEFPVSIRHSSLLLPKTENGKPSF
jgi:hypothetical protein